MILFKKHKRRVIMPIYIIGVALLALVGIALASSTNKKELQHYVTPQLYVSAGNLIDAYMDNEMAADATYKSKLVLVGGKVVSIGKTILGKPYILLSGSDMSKTFIQCSFKNEKDILTLHTGEDIEVIGTVEGKALYIVVKQCILR